MTYVVIRGFTWWEEVSEAMWRSARHAFSTFYLRERLLWKCCPLTITWLLAFESAALCTGRRWQQDWTCAQSFIGGRGKGIRDLPGSLAMPYLLSTSAPPCNCTQLHRVLGGQEGNSQPKGPLSLQSLRGLYPCLVGTSGDAGVLGSSVFH